MTNEELDLAAVFPPADRAAWRDAVEKVLKGRDFDVVLRSETRDGLVIEPLYDATQPGSVAGVSDAGDLPLDQHRVSFGWDVRQHHQGTASRCNLEILEDLDRGVTSIELQLPDQFGDDSYLSAVLNGVLLDLAPIALAPHSSIAFASQLLDLAAAAPVATHTGHWLGLDPLGGIARGESAARLDDVLIESAKFATDAGSRRGAARVFTVDTVRYSEAGATEAQQLAASMATGVAYLRALERSGIELSQAVSMIAFRYTATADQFVTIATLRAARKLWARVLGACGVQSTDCVQAQQVVTSAAMLSRRDPWVNLLRSTTAALAAGVGGANAITVLPFDSALGMPDSLGRRTARNTQMLLIEESHLARLVDPAAGSWFVESLTDRLAEMAWTGFQAIESAGGMASVLLDGSMEAEVSAAWSRRLQSLSTRHESLTGVSEFPLLDEQLLSRPDAAEAPGWPVRRLAAPFEALRDASDRHLAETGSRPKIFIAALGDLASHTARSAWVINLLAVAGIATEGGVDDGSGSPLEAEARFVQSGCDMAVICSSDAIYSERAVATAVALREAGASAVALAGRPGALSEDLRAAGVTQFWHAGIDIVEMLGGLLRHLGIEIEAHHNQGEK